MDIYEFIYATMVLAAGIYFIKLIRDVIVTLYSKKETISVELKPKTEDYHIEDTQCTRIMPYGKRCERQASYNHRGWCNSCDDSRYGY